MTRVAEKRRIRVLIVDDSALMRQLLGDLLSGEDDIEVIGVATDPLVARSMIKAHDPDVLTLDVEMPRMDGLAFLEKLMTLRPMPVVMVSSLTQAGADATLRALELGAVDYVAKPQLDLRQGLTALREELLEKVRGAARARVRPLRRETEAGAAPRGPKESAAPAAGGGVTESSGGGYRSTEAIVAVGASTGGVEALRELICALPPDAPALVVTQHMPERFTTTFANRLNGLAAMTVREAPDGARILPGHVYIAPGNRHLEVARSGADYVCQLHDGPLVSGHRPSVDVLFHSVARSAGVRAIGVILTGMGRDGAEGLLRMRQTGAITIGESESTCVVYGMPKAALEAGAVVVELPLPKIAPEILKHCRRADRAVRI